MYKPTYPHTIRKRAYNHLRRSSWYHILILPSDRDKTFAAAIEVADDFSDAIDYFASHTGLFEVFGASTDAHCVCSAAGADGEGFGAHVEFGSNNFVGVRKL
jgi:hypothetical protein